jgi:hypothetical protein
MEKSLYAAPQGIMQGLDPDVGEIEIEIAGEEAEPEVEEDLGPTEFDDNLAEYLPESELGKISSDLMELVDADINSRKDWVEMLVKGLEVLGMKYEERTEPWNGACGVYSPLLTEAAVRFQSETIIETFPAAGPVKTEIIGAIDKLKEEAAERVGADMNYELTEGMPEYRPEHERMLFNLGLTGSAFKKVYYDPNIGRQTSIYIPAEDVIIPYGSSGARMAERVTHIMRKTKNDIRKLQVSGFYRDVELGEPSQIHTDVEKKKAEEQGYSLTDDERYQICEIQVDYDLPMFEDEDGIARPYIISIEKGTHKVLSIYRNWKEKDPLKLKRDHLVQYDYVPGFGAYGLGYIHLIGGYARAGTSIIRQLVDAGTLSNLPGGLKTRGLRTKGDDTPIAPGEFRDVDIASGALRDNIMPLPYKEPSQVLAALLKEITDEGRRLGSIADMNVSDMGANAPVGTTLALLERQLKTMSAVQARVHYSMKQEFKLLKEIIREHAPKSYAYDPDKADRKAKQSDYDLVEVIPVSDPNSSTMAQRIMQYQAVIQLSQSAPQIYDLPMLHRQMIEVLGVKNADKLVPTEDDEMPKDPISENMGFLKGKPTKAFIFQDHDAHIAVHSTFMQDPMIAQQIGQNPMAQQMQAAIQAHIADHLAFQYRSQIEKQLGVQMPAPDAKLPPDQEVQLSRLVAQAAVQLTQQHQAMASQQQAQQQAQDPLVQMQQQELQIKAAQAQTQAHKVQGELALKQAEIQLKQQQAGVQAAQVQPTQGAVQTPEQLNQQHIMDVAQATQQMHHAEHQHRQNLVHAEKDHQLKLKQEQEKHILDMATKAQQAREKMDIQQQQADAQMNQPQEPANG